MVILFLTIMKQELLCFYLIHKVNNIVLSYQYCFSFVKLDTLIKLPRPWYLNTSLGSGCKYLPSKQHSTCIRTCHSQSIVLLTQGVNIKRTYTPNVKGQQRNSNKNKNCPVPPGSEKKSGLFLELYDSKPALIIWFISEPEDT